MRLFGYWKGSQVSRAKVSTNQDIQSTYRTMLGTYRLEVAKGVFDVPDGNSERFLSVSAKLLATLPRC